MAGIPRVLDTDAEDVIWALQTADALWKRGERVDAIVWLRRAAQAAGDAEDDDRAFALAREAAELAEWLAQNPQPAATRSVPPGAETPTPGEAVDNFLRQAVDEPALPAQGERGSQPKTPAAAPPLPPQPSSAKFKVERVASAAEVHAGMLDPWAEAEAPTREGPISPGKAAPSPPPPLPRLPAAAPPPPPAASEFDADEVLTSAPPVVARASRPDAAVAPALAPTASKPEAPASVPGVDLSRVEALADLPEDARDGLAQTATVNVLARDEEVSGFALALVIEGSVDLSATIVDAAAQRLDAGAILRSRGTVGPAAPLRLVAASERATVAAWDEQAVSRALGACPWVEEELRAAGDRFQALVGVTMGALGERLDAGLRSSVTDRLRVRALAEHEVFAVRGEPMPGFLVVGAGELELVGEDGAPNGTVLVPGDFLFPNEVLQSGPAPHTVRASRGGALVLIADRAMAQELLVTCPPLLEIFAGA
jgi:hypothetical protein